MTSKPKFTVDPPPDVPEELRSILTWAVEQFHRAEDRWPEDATSRLQTLELVNEHYVGEPDITQISEMQIDEIITTCKEEATSEVVILRGDEYAQSLEHQYWNKYFGEIFFSYYSNGTGDADIRRLDPVTENVSTYTPSGRQDIRFGFASPIGTYGTDQYLLMFDSTISSVVLIDMGTDPWTTKLSRSESNTNGQVVAEDNGYIIYHAGSLRYIQKSSYSTTHVMPSPPSGYSEYPAGVQITDQASAFMMMLRRTSDNHLALCRLEFSEGGGAFVWGTPDVDSQLSGYSMGTHLTPVRDKRDGIWWPIEKSGQAAFLVTTEDGVIQGVYDCDTDFASTVGTWSSSAGYPVVHYNSDIDAIFYNYGNKIHQLNCADFSVTEFDINVPGSWCVFHYDTDTVWTGAPRVNDDLVTYKVTLTGTGCH